MDAALQILKDYGFPTLIAIAALLALWRIAERQWKHFTETQAADRAVILAQIERERLAVERERSEMEKARERSDQLAREERDRFFAALEKVTQAYQDGLNKVATLERRKER